MTELLYSDFQGVCDDEVCSDDCDKDKDDTWQ
jgi:hypothetical protein